jgi:hypothetical protein
MKNAGLFPVLEGAAVTSIDTISHTSSLQSAMRDVGQTEEQILRYNRKIEVEHSKGRALEKNIKVFMPYSKSIWLFMLTRRCRFFFILQEVQDRISSLHAITLGGNVIDDSVRSYKKKISIQEKKLQTLRMQLSKSGSENHMLKDRINFLRTDKLMYLNIHNDLVCPCFLVLLK